MRYPTRALLRCIREKPSGDDFWLDHVSPLDAWRLARFLNEILVALWMNYGSDILDYQRNEPRSDFDTPLRPDPHRTRVFRKEKVGEDIPF